MLEKSVIALIHREVVPAIGCTEPIAVALCVARASEILNNRHPQRITAQLSANILKNAMGVGIPGTDMIGLPIAIALGALIGKSEYGLEVLKDCTPEAVEEGKKLIDTQAIQISLKEGIEEKLYIEVCCEADGNKATAIISGGHTHFVYESLNDEVLLNIQSGAGHEGGETEMELNLRKVRKYVSSWKPNASTNPQPNAHWPEAMDTNWGKPSEAAVANSLSWATTPSHTSCRTPRPPAMPVWPEP